MDLLKYNERGAEAKWLKAFHYGENGRYLTMVGWLVVWGFNGPLRQYFSLYRAVSQREGEREEKGHR